MNDDKKIRARIRALLALADDPGASESERQVAFERASAMMAPPPPPPAPPTAS